MAEAFFCAGSSWGSLKGLKTFVRVLRRNGERLITTQCFLPSPQVLHGSVSTIEYIQYRVSVCACVCCYNVPTKVKYNIIPWDRFTPGNGEMHWQRLMICHILHVQLQQEKASVCVWISCYADLWVGHWGLRIKKEVLGFNVDSTEDIKAQWTPVKINWNVLSLSLDSNLLLIAFGLKRSMSINVS